MAKSDVIVRMKADTSNYDANIAKARKQLDQFGKNNLTVGGQMKQLTSVLVSSAAKFTSFGAAVGAAMKVTKDAFNASEASVDEWGRALDAGRSMYEGFLTALNTGDISGYLSRIDQIVAAARAAYNELDRLGTMKTIQAPALSAQQTENERMRMMIRTGRYIAPIDGRRAMMQNGQLLTPGQIRALERNLQGGMQKIVSLVGNEVKQTGRAIDAVYNRQSKELGMSLTEFRKGTSSMAEFDKRMAGYEKYKQWDARAQTEFARQGGRGYVNFDASNPYASFRKWGTFRVDGERYKQLVQLIQQRDQQASQTYATMSQAYQTINRAEGINVRKLLGGGGGGGGRGGGATGGTTTGTNEILPVGSVAALNKELQELRKQQELATDTTGWMKQQREIDKITSKVKILKGEIADPNQIQQGGGASISGLLNSNTVNIPEEIKIDGIPETVKDIEKIYKASEMAANAVSSIGSAFANIEDPTAKAAGTVMQAIASIALGFAQAAAAKDTTASGWAWLGWLAAGAAAMATTISTIHSLTGFENGGEIKGNSYSGDNIPIMANAGEVVLTRAMAGNLASQLEGAATNVHVTGEVHGTKLVLVMNRALKVAGKGEIVTWK
jgi:uncharacterized protein (DUF1330 family)